ncbi:hypothetical protein NA57DRAFT_54956 [Rhizodiscina lignyota]|uniref:Uncharacterized protein n=1 Tax=Rhizodiscina lignyota TaxID=1504668 RepID=A0A9P4IKE1_9PEZI|nr:hypothetical protein NA57DRAFT_54956 [Rhizodiscina lignyota]
MYVLDKSIEISASPTEVREKFLDFSQLPNYHPNGFFRSIKPTIPDKPFEAGDKVDIVFEFGGSTATCLANSPTEFRWIGSVPLIFSGEHTFRFTPSTTTPGGTTFYQEEKFTGALSFMMGDSFVARQIGFQAKTKNGWERYNQDLKAWCEGSK